MAAKYFEIKNDLVLKFGKKLKERAYKLDFYMNSKIHVVAMEGGYFSK